MHSSHFYLLKRYWRPSLIAAASLYCSIGEPAINQQVVISNITNRITYTLFTMTIQPCMSRILWEIFPYNLKDTLTKS